MTQDEFLVAFTRILDGVRQYENGATNRRTTPDDEKRLAEEIFALVLMEWAVISSDRQLTMAFVETARISSIDERTQAIMRRLSPPMDKEAFLAFFARQLECDSHRSGAQTTRVVLDSEVENLANHIRLQMVCGDNFERTTLINFFLLHPRGFTSNQDRAQVFRAYLTKS